MEFQNSAGIPFDDQIILLDNPGVFSHLQSCFYPWRKTRSPATYLRETWKQRLLFNPSRGALAKGLHSERLFAGYFDYSFNDLGLLKAVFQFLGKRSEKEFRLVIGKGDYLIDETFLEQLPPNLSYVLANNVNTTDSRIHYLPMGRDFRSLALFPDLKPSSLKKTLCYCNFSIDTHPIREFVAKQLQGKSFVKMDHMGSFLNYQLSRAQFFECLRESKFCICPRGNAFDTFRLWDCLYVGTIPIVVQEAVFHKELQDLPILFLDSYEELVNLDKDYLEEKYNSLLSEKFNYRKLFHSYWLNKLDSDGPKIES